MSNYNKAKWQRTRQRWFDRYAPDINGQYICIICNKHIEANVLTLDHILRVEDFPQFRYSLDNLQPAHNTCNQFRDEVMRHPERWEAWLSKHSSKELRDTVERIIAQAQIAYKKYEWIHKIKRL